MNFKQAHVSNFTTGRTQSIMYIVIHYTANDGDTAKNNVDYYARESLKASAHYFVDEKEVWQSVKESDTAYHCGANSYKHKECRNSNSIGIELCSRQYEDGTYYIKPETVANGIKLTKELMAKYNIPEENVIRHYDVTGKICPAPMVKDEKQWESFKKELRTIQELVTPNDIVWELGHRGFVTDTKGMLDEMNQNPDGRLYWLARKMLNYIRRNEVV